MNLTQVVDNALKAFRRDVPEYLAAGVVDLSTGVLFAPARQAVRELEEAR